LSDVDTLFAPQFGLSMQHLSPQSIVDVDTLYQLTVSTEPHYNYPIGHSLKSDYGIREAKTRRGRLIIGRL
jgi:hypothetical protein